MLVLLLVMGWTIVAVVQVRRFRERRRQVDSVGAFRDHLAVLERTTPATVLPMRLRPATAVAAEVPFPLGSAVRSLHTTLPVDAHRSLPGGMPSCRERRRRRRVVLLRTLVLASVVSLVLGLVTGVRPVLAVHLVVDLLLVGYMVLLVRHRKAELERRRKVRYLRTSHGPSEPDPLFARAVGG
jgi:hypothetical protein